MSSNPYAPPKANVADAPEEVELEYAGFWIRVLAAIIDGLIIAVITYPILYLIYGETYLDQTDIFAGPADLIVTYVFPAVASIWFWLHKQGTPGKMALSLRIVDATTGNTLTLGQSIVRYFGYFVAAIPLGLGILWVAFDQRKQGLHDKLAKSVVVRARSGARKPNFNQQ